MKIEIERDDASLLIQAIGVARRLPGEFTLDELVRMRKLSEGLNAQMQEEKEIPCQNG